ncbi:MAG TPA: hypothetical protein VFA94_17100 [Acidimicrobiales bacterium]|nr:hypothetical protein [Acidimicrobiales bacterium]
MSRRHRFAGALVAAALTWLSAAALCPNPSRAVTDPASLPPQPGIPAPPCTPRLGPTNTWATMGQPVPVAGPNSDGIPPYRLTMDPWRPCLGYRVAGDNRKLERTTDAGTTWHVVFFDDRTSANGNPLRITGIYAPDRDTVYVSEDGNGMAVVRSLDAGTTWQPANVGLAGQPVRQLFFAPSDPAVGYALAFSGGLGGQKTAAQVTFFVTKNAGVSWQQAQTPALVTPDPPAFAVDPTTAGTVFLVLNGSSGWAGQSPGARTGSAVLLESNDFGNSYGKAKRLDSDAVGLFGVERPGGALRLYLLTNSIPRGIRHSDDRGATWTDDTLSATVTWFGGLPDPVDGDHVLYFGTPGFGAKDKLVTLYTRDGFATQEYGTQPPITSNRFWGTGSVWWTVDRYGQFYLDVGIECANEHCDPSAPQTPGFTWYAWQTLRFRPPNFGEALVVGGAGGSDKCQGTDCTGTLARVPQPCVVTAQAPLYPRLSGNSDDSGALASDGTHLYYTVRGETGPDPSSGVIRIADPTTCKETGRLIVHFDPATYAAARAKALSDRDGSHLLPPRPAIDSLAYDSVHDELWFSLDRTADYVDAYNGNGTAPFPAWAVPRAGAAPDRNAELRFWTQPCAPGGLGLLAHDRAKDTLWTCDAKLPGELSRTGQSLPVCLHPLFQGRTSEDAPWPVDAWGLTRPGTIMALVNGKVQEVDVRACRQLHTWSPAVTDHVPEPYQGGPEDVSMQLVCDALTFRAGLPGATAAPDAVAWTRSGPNFIAYTAPGLACPSPTALSYTGAANVQPGQAFEACATVRVPGPGAGLAAVPVTFDVLGVSRKALTDSGGQACTPVSVAGSTPQGTLLPVHAAVAADVHMVASAAVGSVLVGQVPVPPPPPPAPPPPVGPAPPVQPPAPPPPVVPFLPAPAPAAQATVQAPTPPPGQAVSQQGMASEKEKEVQLAHAQQESSGSEADYATEPAVADKGDDSYAMVGIGAAALALGAMTAGAALARGGATAPAYALASATSRRRRRWR